jgi:purine-binding chemotaxis protein CheW
VARQKKDDPTPPSEEPQGRQSPQQSPAQPEAASAPSAAPSEAWRPVSDTEVLHEEALVEFFASEKELDATGAMSLDLYRDQLDTRLRAEGVQEYLSFVLASEIYAVNIFHIKEIIKPPMITKVPRTEGVILGILSLRGNIATVVDLRRRLGLRAEPQTRKSRVLIVQLDDDLVGLLVDAVKHVIRLKSEDIEPPPGVFDRSEAEHIVGVGRVEGEMYTLLDLESVVQIDKFLKR